MCSHSADISNGGILKYGTSIRTIGAARIKNCEFSVVTQVSVKRTGVEKKSNRASDAASTGGIAMIVMTVIFLGIAYYEWHFLKARQRQKKEPTGL